ncbi:MAG: hypothetical protein JXA52_09895 [Planctomycetes bacterium]|nr:hypothetical protein [Planctomycetota bacterium]
MLILSRGKITVKPSWGGSKQVLVEGELTPFEARIKYFFSKLPLDKGVVRLRGNQYLFSKEFTEEMQQRARNFLFAECQVKDL